jgi:hypothetical protein
MKQILIDRFFGPAGAIPEFMERSSTARNLMLSSMGIIAVLNSPAGEIMRNAS